MNAKTLVTILGLTIGAYACKQDNEPLNKLHTGVVVSRETYSNDWGGSNIIIRVNYNNTQEKIHARFSSDASDTTILRHAVRPGDKITYPVKDTTENEIIKITYSQIKTTYGGK